MAKKKLQKQNTVLSPENYIRQRSRNLPIHECWITSDWNKQKLASIVISRKHASGNITYCMYLADTACLGVKNTVYKYNDSEDNYYDFIENMKENVSIEKASYDLVHNIIYASLEFAEEYGFEPHKDFKSVTQYFLEEDTEDILLMEIECGGDDGKPLYINSGHESQARENQILKQLEKYAGEGNYNYILPLGDNNTFEDKDEEDEEDEDEDENEEEDIDDVEKIKRRLYCEDIDVLKEQFLDLLDKKDNSDDFQVDKLYHLIAISEIITEDLADEDIIDDNYFALEDDLSIVPVDLNEIPNSLFKGIQNIDGEVLTDMFHNIINAIYEKDKASGKISTLKKKVGDVPLIDYLLLLNIKINNNKKYNKTLEDCYRKHPDYFLFELLRYEDLYVKNGDENALAQIKSLLHNDELQITHYELSRHIIIYAAHVYKIFEDFKFEKLIAFEKFLNDYEYQLDTSIHTMISTLNLYKVKVLADNIQKKEDND